MKNKTLIEAKLSQFIGSEKFYRHSLVRKVRYTEGVEYVAKHGEAHWLIDEIAFHQIDPAFVAEEFQVWVLAVNADDSATLTCEDDNGRVVFSQKIPSTDFPLPEIKFYCINNMILLPSEY